MVINCESCHAALEVPDSLADGQPVRCPYCHCRFVYVPHGREATGESREDDRGGEGSRQSSAEQKPVDGSAELWATVLPFCRHALSSWVSAWKSMFDFGGRMSRRDYLEFVAFQFFMVEVVCFLHAKCNIFFVKHNLDFFFYSMFFVNWIMLFPLVSAAFRRFHDANRSGRLLLLFSPFLLRADGMAVGLFCWSDMVAFGGFSWYDFLWIAFFVVIGMQRTQNIDNVYLSLQSIRWSLVAFACMMLIPASKVIERVHCVKNCENWMRQQYEDRKEWYNQQLNYNGLREISFIDRDGIATLVFLNEGGQIVEITYMYERGMIEYSRSFQKEFAEELISARLFVKNYEKNEKR